VAGSRHARVPVRANHAYGDAVILGDRRKRFASNAALHCFGAPVIAQLELAAELERVAIARAAW